MFGRVAACSIAAFFLVSPARSSGETKAFVHVDAPAASVVFAMTHNQTREQTQDRVNDDAQTHAKAATLDPADPSFKSPAATAPGIQSSALAEPFGLKTVSVEGGELLAKWVGVEADIRAESEILARCHENAESCPPSAKDFLAIIAEGRAHTGRARIGVINRAINLAIQPMSDLAQWGVPNRWIAPLVTFTTGHGNCKDYAIAKYVALREAGVADDDVRLVIVRNLAADEDHAVTAVRLDGNWIMLDNRWLTLVDDNEMDRVIPLFVLDDAGVRKFVPAIWPAAGQASTSREGVAAASL
jgi:predicted transglutaminase-like cysteine proteinase